MLLVKWQPWGVLLQQLKLLLLAAIDKDAAAIDEVDAEKNSTTAHQDEEEWSCRTLIEDKVKKETEVGFKTNSHSKIEVENLQVINVR